MPGMSIERPSAPAINEEWTIFTEDTAITTTMIVTDGCPVSKRDPRVAGLFFFASGGIEAKRHCG
jgi:hypothetical protein